MEIAKIKEPKTAEQIKTLQAQWGSDYTPEELAKIIYYTAEKTRGAVGKLEFDGLLSQINPKNVVEVLETIQRIPENKEKRSRSHGKNN